MKESAVTRVTGGLSGSGRGGMEWWVLMEVCVALLSPRGQLYKTGVLTCQRVLLYESVSIRWVGKREGTLAVLVYLHVRVGV